MGYSLSFQYFFHHSESKECHIPVNFCLVINLVLNANYLVNNSIFLIFVYLACMSDYILRLVGIDEVQMNIRLFGNSVAKEISNTHRLRHCGWFTWVSARLICRSFNFWFVNCHPKTSLIRLKCSLNGSLGCLFWSLYEF